jgi:hypothetical protein
MLCGELDNGLQLTLVRAGVAFSWREGKGIVEDSAMAIGMAFRIEM